MIRKPIMLFFALLAMAACRTPQDIAYLQDVKEYEEIPTPHDGYIRFKKGDKMQINVHSRDEKMRELFNINEPIIFGLPIVFNPYLLVPFVLVPLFAMLITWLAIYTG